MHVLLLFFFFWVLEWNNDPDPGSFLFLPYFPPVKVIMLSGQVILLSRPDGGKRRSSPRRRAEG